MISFYRKFEVLLTYNGDNDITMDVVDNTVAPEGNTVAPGLPTVAILPQAHKDAVDTLQGVIVCLQNVGWSSRAYELEEVQEYLGGLY